MVIRRDFFVLFLKILFFLLLCIIPLGFFLVVSYSDIAFLGGPISGPVILLLTSAYYLFAWVFFFFSFIDYYLDIWIITSERIIDIQQKGFFSRTISEQKLFRIQDVTSEVHGIIPTMLKYGNVHVQTAGTKERFFFHEVPNPDKIRDSIIRLVEKNQRKHKQELSDDRAGDMEEVTLNEEVQEVIGH